MIPWSWLAAVAALLVLLAGAAEAGRRWERAGWLEREAKAVQAAAAVRDESLRLANAAAARAEGLRDRAAADLETARRDIRTALAAPADCPPGIALRDLRVPAAALAGLRHAAGADLPSGPATGELGAAVP